MKVAWESLGINIKMFGCWLKEFVSAFLFVAATCFYFGWRLLFQTSEDVLLGALSLFLYMFLCPSTLLPPPCLVVLERSALHLQRRGSAPRAWQENQ